MASLESQATAFAAGVKPKTAGDAGDDDEEIIEQGGFSLLHVILVAILALLIGRLLATVF